MPVYGKYLGRDIRYVINEAYVGKTDTLLEMEEAINKIRTNCKKFTDINKSKEVQALNRLFEKQFGMEVYALQVDQSNTMNAYTIPINTRFDVGMKTNISRYVVGDKKNGYKFKEGNGLGIMAVIYWGLLMNPEFTDAEILAVLLHELGHNFADAIYDKIKFANQDFAKGYYTLLIVTAIIQAITIVGIPSAIVTLKQAKDNTNKQVVKKAKNKGKNPLRGISNGIKASLGNVAAFTNEVLARLGGGFGLKLSKLGIDKEKNKEYLKSKSEGRQNEVIADKFAGVYGYGPDQVSALLKMHEYKSGAEKFVDKIPLIGKLRNASFSDAMKDIHDFDVHPHVIQRANEEIKLLEAELTKSDLDPKMAKVIREQIKQMQDMIKKATTVVEDSQKSEKVRAAYYAYINGEDPDAVNEDIEGEIHDALDKALERKE